MPAKPPQPYTTEMESVRPARGQVLRFGIFEMDVHSGELRRNGVIVRLSPQPYQVLRLLLEHPGAVVDREQIRRQIWGDTTVDFDRSLNVCIAQIRTALNDDADRPRFLQTLPRRGYRFLADVERVGPEPQGPPARRRYRVLAGMLAAGTAIAALAAIGYRPGHPPQNVLRIAVLPFDTVAISADNAQTEGLFDELLTRLGGVQPDRLQVIGRRSAMVFRGVRKPLREIGAQLKVQYLVESTATMEGAHLRVAARLLQAESETLIWSETLVQDRSAEEFEEQFVARVSAAVFTKLFPAAFPLVAQQSVCRDGWDAYRTAHLLADHGTMVDMQKSLPFFEQAACAPSRALLAQTLTRLARIGPRRPALWERAKVAAHAALDTGTSTASAHLALGNVAFWQDWDWKTAEREFQAALRDNPSDPDAHHDIAWLYMAMGRRKEGLASLERALAMDPFSAYINMDAAWLLLQAGRVRESAAQARRTLEIDPQLREARLCLSRALMYAGDDRGALEAMRGLVPQVVSEDEMRAVAGLAPAEAIRRLMRPSNASGGAMDHYQRGSRLAWLGSREEALAEVEAAFQERSPMMPMLASDPGFASIRDEARFRKVVHDLGL
jgi:DNA-binding winged helix-turn-helix (wHTH) protein/TolB-like protein/thioredoxin-like negative regulator of GroEL